MNQFKAEGKTMTFVSNALNTVKALRQRSLLLSKGRVATIGNIEKVMNDYLAMLQGGTTRASSAGMI